MFIIHYRKVFYAIAILLVGFSIFSIAKFGLNYGIDFKGGTIIEVHYTQNASSTDMMSNEQIRTALQSQNLGEVIVRQAGENGYIIRTKALSEIERKAVVATLGGEVKRFDSVGPVLGDELKGKAVWSIILVILAIVLFITYVFRHVSRPIASWKYGAVAIIALLHDVLIPTGIFAFMGRNGGYEIDALFVTALLVILGFSVHDTIVVFDRTRENLRINSNKKTFSQIVGESITQTLSRSINTSLTTMLSLLALYFFGPETTKNFSLVLILGIAVGTYSSIFVGSPLLVTLEKWQSKKK
ncbi:MAG: protein translocase subunit SecF [Candidatus Taylorbacteria bacterium]|nr:protein translocase subunit SecF [Candidatus Taylorbacteria bacterium]